MEIPFESAIKAVGINSKPRCLKVVDTFRVLLTTVRAHWAIENALHWQLDVTFREDAARNRKDNGPANIAVLRRRALDIARRDTSKCSLTIKLKRAGWDDDFLLSLLRKLQVPQAKRDGPAAPAPLRGKQHRQLVDLGHHHDYHGGSAHHVGRHSFQALLRNWCPGRDFPFPC